MKKRLQNTLLIVLGWLFIVLALIGVILPILPTTPFLIVALALFSRSSPRFHQMLLSNAWFGPTLRQWEETKTLARATKYKSSVLIVITFSLSIFFVTGKAVLQIVLLLVAVVLLTFIWRVKEPLADCK